MGRPSKLTQDVKDKVLEAIGKGCTREVAAAYAGIGERTLYQWISYGNKPPQTSAMEERLAPYRQFAQALTRAEATAEVEAVSVWQAAFKDDWRAVVEWLARKYPDRWGRKERVDIEVLIRQEARRLADTLGLSEDEIVAEAQRILAGSH